MQALRLLLSFVTCTALVAQDADPPAPKVVERSPAHLCCDVDAATTVELVVTFDQPMSQSSWSFCGGGPAFPKGTEKPVWKNDRTIVLKVALEPDHDYQLSLNCPAASGFRSKKGTPLPPTAWTFSTLPKDLPDQKQQKPRNKQALAKLQQTIDGVYSHRDLRVHDWKKLWAEATATLQGAKTDKAFAAAAAMALQPTADIHLYVRCGDQTFPTGTRAIDSLFRADLVPHYVAVKPCGDAALVGRTDDGIGYLMVRSWTRELDLDALDAALAGLRDCKAMVVDARPNSGGDEGLAQRVAAWFVDGIRVYAKNRYRNGPGKDAFGPVNDRSLAGNGADKRLRGPVAVLTSRYVMSSNESFVMMLQQSKDCTLVGQPTFGSSGNPKPVDLGNGVTIVVPTWQDLRLDGTCIEGEGVQPDVVVPCTAAQLQTEDPILAKALQILRGKLAK